MSEMEDALGVLCSKKAINKFKSKVILDNQLNYIILKVLVT